MRPLILSLAAMLTAMATPLSATTPQNPSQEPGFLVIAHRGASAERPEHTLAAYERAIDQGADYIEPDLVVTKDGALVARHENEISETTDVARRPEFADRRRTKTIDGRAITGWFVEDFTLAELQTLRARERLPGIRTANTAFDGLYQIPTLAEIVRLVRAKEAETGRRIGLYPELKHPTFLMQEEGVDTVDLLLLSLKELGIAPDDPVYIQCFEVGPLQRLNARSDFRLIQLVDSDGGPADEPGMRYGEMVSASGMERIATYADGIGAPIAMVLEGDGTPSGLVSLAHANALKVHAWTLRPENAFLPVPLQSAGGPAAAGNAAQLQVLLMRAGADGVFADSPGQASRVRKERQR